MPGNELMLHPARGQRLTLEELAEAADLHPGLVEGFVAYGLVEPGSTEGSARRFDVRAVGRLRKIQRLRLDLGINLPGLAVVLELLERIEALQRELTSLRRR